MTVALPSYIDQETWEAFISQRKAMKSVPFTDQAQKLLIRKLIKLHDEGHDANAALEKAAICGHRSVFAPELAWRGAEPLWRTEQRQRTQAAAPGVASDFFFDLTPPAARRLS